MTTPLVHVHFGIHRVHPRHEEPKFRGHSNPSEEKEILLRDIGETVYVSGSWKCWGPADQATDGDSTLHVLVITDRFARMRDSLLEDWLVSLHHEIGEGAVAGCLAYDYAVLTTDDHSDVIGTVLFTDRTATIYHGR